MHKFKKKIYSYLYILFLFLFFNFSEFSTNKSYSKNFVIYDVEVEEKYNLNFDKSKVIDKGFLKAFNVLIRKILEKKDQKKIINISIQDVKYLIENFSILNETFINQNYQIVLEVQFNRNKIIKFLDQKKVFSSLPKEINTFILPVLIDSENNELYSLNQNIFFKLWNDVDESYFLVKYVLPNEDIEDHIIIKKNINNLENYNFNEIIKKYNLDSHIILILIKNDNKLRIYSKINFENKNMLLNKSLSNIDINNQILIKNLILEIKNEYEDKWKSINKLDTTIELPIRLSLNSKNIELSKKLEKTLLNLDFVSDFKIEKFNNNEIMYKIIFNNTPQKFLDYINMSEFKIDTSKAIWKLYE